MCTVYGKGKMQNILILSIEKEYPSADIYPSGYPVRTPDEFSFLSRLRETAAVLGSLHGSCCRRARDTRSSGPELECRVAMGEHPGITAALPPRRQGL